MIAQQAHQPGSKLNCFRLPSRKTSWFDVTAVPCYGKPVETGLKGDETSARVQSLGATAGENI